MTTHSRALACAGSSCGLPWFECKESFSDDPDCFACRRVGEANDTNRWLIQHVARMAEILGLDPGYAWSVEVVAEKLEARARQVMAKASECP